MFENWLYKIDKISKAQIRLGVCALLWVIWTCRNDVIFNDTNRVQFLQVIHKATYWINMWSYLQSEDQ
jgi:hypothetical protein